MWNMKYRQVLAVLLHSASVARFALAISSVSIVALSSAAKAADVHTTGARTVIVRPKFGGQVLGYDIDRNGTQGLLSEYVSLGNGKNLVATETFDQKTGKIVKIVAKKNQTMDDYVTLGVFGGIGLDLFQHVVGQFQIKNHFLIINPLDAGKFTPDAARPLGVSMVDRLAVRRSQNRMVERCPKRYRSRDQTVLS